MSTEDDIRAVIGAYEQALNTADPALAVSCFTSDGVVMRQGLPTVAGEELPATYDGILHSGRSYDIRLIVDEVVVVSEDFAYVITHSRGIITLPDRRYAGANREMFLLRRVDGQWKISRYLFNNDAPLAPA